MNRGWRRNGWRLLIMNRGWGRNGCSFVYYESRKRELKIIRLFLFYYESRKREFETRLVYQDRSDERLKN